MEDEEDGEEEEYGGYSDQAAHNTP
jgi:hypothetical protein